jgi:hypothetical protein
MKIDKDKEYIEGKTWVCEKSPTGAHHMIISEGGKTQRCKYCKVTSQVPTVRYFHGKQIINK